MVVSLFLGPWSDRKGRKTLIMLPFVGYFLFCMVNITNCYFFYELYAEFLWFENVSSLFGGWVLFFIGCYGYLADTTSPESRSGLLTSKWMRMTSTQVAEQNSPQNHQNCYSGWILLHLRCYRQLLKWSNIQKVF